MARIVQEPIEMMTDDPEIRAIQTAQRKKLLRNVGIGAVVIIAAAVSILPSGGAVERELLADGYDTVDVSRSGLFAFTYDASKKGMKCSGSVEKVPGSTTSTSLCTSASD